ncbi:SDR family NAD(P)-dependent oxidoreductase [Actinomadura parmotrematis]|uniref:SDR family NAD(P)-dependent oxidoreductase n=1 Tax=Actinomadura parmotrematis TaxID=2864039 RepID=UPI0027E38212|nr:SDR family NAD(P)-dependent oxidoreductase [Actinomadura parmotrematis]
MLVSGGNRGIGREVCRQLVARGDEVLLGARAPEKAAEAAREVGAVPVVLDVTSDADARRVADEVESRYGRLDVLVNNAAITYDTWQRTATADLDVVRGAAETNLYGPWRLVQAVLPQRASADRERVERGGAVGEHARLHAVEDRAERPDTDAGR